MKLTRLAIWLVVVSVLAGCGGGGGNPGTTSAAATTTTATTATTTATTASTTDTTTTPTAAVPVAASFVFSLDKSFITNGGTDKATLTVTALDASRNVVSGVPVSVSLDSGIYTAISSSTDASGVATGGITIGGNKTNRSITANITVGSQKGTAIVGVTGSRLSLAALPATPSPGASVQVTVRAVDSTGAGIAGAAIQLGGSLGLTQLVTTDLSGAAVATLGAAPAAGTYTVTGTGLGVTSSQDVQVVATGGGGGIPVAVGTISSASLSITPNSVFANVAGAVTNQAQLRAVFQDAANQAIQNVRVRFEIVPPGLGSGEQISTGTTTVYSDISGVALSAYVPGTRTSPTNGVVVRACYGLTDAAIAGALCPSSVVQTLTVGGQAVSVTLGFNNELSKGNNNLTYIQRFVAAVTDSNGNAVPNAVVSASVDVTHYGKGFVFDDGYVVEVLPTTSPVTLIQLVTPPDKATVGTTTSLNPKVAVTGPPLVPGYRVWCPNEDVNRNGFLDTGEDTNSNGKLDSPKADVILSFSGTNVTASDGTLQLQVQYPQNVATWLSFTIKVSVGVAGSEGSIEKSFFTTFIKGDEANGSFRTPPFGTKNCTMPD